MEREQKMNYYSKNGCVVGKYFYCVSTDEGILTRIDLDNYDIHYFNIGKDTVLRADPVSAVIEDGGLLYLLPRNDTYIRIIDSENMQLQEYSIEKDCFSKDGNFFFSSLLAQGNIYLFPGNNNSIINLEISNTQIQEEHVIELSNKYTPVFGKSAIFLKNRAILNTIYPRDSHGLLGVFDMKSKEIDFAFESDTKRGFEDIQLYGDKLLGLCADGSLYVMDIENQIIEAECSGIFDKDMGYRTLRIENNMAYALSMRNGTILVYDLINHEKKSIASHYCGFYGLYHIKEDYYLSAIGDGSLALLRIKNESVEVIHELHVFEKYELYKKIVNKDLIFEEDSSDLHSFLGYIGL